MKLVSAKCPSCGADIEVDKNSDKTVCEYCNSKIVVEDAITKYKVELSGEVTIANLPKVKTLSINADRLFDSCEYDEAFEKYDKLLELDPNQPKAIYRKSLIKNVLDDDSYNPTKCLNSLSILEKLVSKEDMQDYVQNLIISIGKKIKIIDNRFANKEPGPTSIQEIEHQNDDLVNSLSALEELFKLVDDDNFKFDTIDIIVCCCDALLRPRTLYKKARAIDITINGYVKETLYYKGEEDIVIKRNYYQRLSEKIYEKLYPKTEEVNDESDKDESQISFKAILKIFGVVIGIVALVVIISAVIFDIIGPSDQPFMNVSYVDEYSHEKIAFLDNKYLLYIVNEKTNKYRYRVSGVGNEIIKFDKYTLVYNSNEETICFMEKDNCVRVLYYSE